MTGAARLRLAVFALCVLGVPAALMMTGAPKVVDLGRLAMILLPGPMGLALLPRTRRTGRPGVRWLWIGLAALLTLGIAAGSLGAAAAAGLVRTHGAITGARSIAAAAGGSALTSVLEEWGWAGGGLTLAVAALGRRWGVMVLGLVWAAWHLIPVALHIGMFPDLEAGPPARLVAFVAACLIYRELLTRLRERAGTWFAAAAGHAAPNAALAALMASGLGRFQGAADWRLYPAPGGLVFPVLAAGVVLGLGWRRKAPSDGSAVPVSGQP